MACADSTAGEHAMHDARTTLRMKVKVFDFINGIFHLLQLDGNSHVIYAEDEAAGTRLLIDGRTCLLQVKRVYFDLKSSICFYYGRGN
jgi:hypothetical protein